MSITKAQFKYEYGHYRVAVYDKDDYCWSVSLHPTLYEAYDFIMRDMRHYQGFAYKITNAIKD